MKRIILLIALVFMSTIKAEPTLGIYTSRPVGLQASVYVHEIPSKQKKQCYGVIEMDRYVFDLLNLNRSSQVKILIETNANYPQRYEEKVDLVKIKAGKYAALVHGKTYGTDISCSLINFSIKNISIPISNLSRSEAGKTIKNIPLKTRNYPTDEVSIVPSIEMKVPTSLNLEDQGTAFNKFRMCEAGVHIPEETYRRLGLTEDTDIFYEAFLTRNDKTESIQTLSAKVGTDRSQGSSKVNGFYSRLNSDGRGLACALTSVTINGRVFDFRLFDTSTGNAEKTKTVTSSRYITTKYKNTTEWADAISTALIYLGSNMSEELYDVIYKNAEGVYALDAFKKLVLNLAQQSAFTISNTGIVKDFIGLNKSEIVELIKGKLSSTNVFANDPSGQDELEIIKENVTDAYFRQLRQDIHFPYGSEANIMATTALALMYGTKSAIRVYNTSSSLLNAYQRLITEYAELDSVISEDNLFVSVSPDKVAALNYVSANKGDWVNETTEGKQTYSEVVFNNSPFSINENNLLEGGNIVGKTIIAITKEVFSNEDDYEPKSLEIVAVQMALDELGIDSSYPYGSFNNIKGTAAKRYIQSGEILPSAEIEYGDWTILYDYLDERYKNSSDREHLVPSVVGSVRMNVGAFSDRTVTLKTILNQSDWVNLDHPKSVMFKYKAIKNNTTYWHTVSVGGVPTADGGYNFTKTKHDLYSTGVNFCLSEITYYNDFSETVGHFAQGEICDGSTYDGEKETLFRRPSIPATIDQAQNIREVAVELTKLMHNHSKNKEDFFEVFEMAADAIAEIGEALLVIGQDDDGNDQYGLALEREYVAKRQLRRYGASESIIDKYWQKYIDQGSVALMKRGGDYADIPDSVITNESNWLRNSSRFTASSSITQIWNTILSDNLYLIAKGISTTILFDGYKNGHFTRNQLFDESASSSEYRIITQIRAGANRFTYYDKNWVILNRAGRKMIYFSKDIQQSFNSGNDHDINYGAPADSVFSHSAEDHRIYTYVDNLSVCALYPDLAYMWCKISEHYTRYSPSFHNGVTKALYAKLSADGDQYKSITTPNEISLEVIRGIVPIWGTIYAIQTKDDLGSILGILSDVMTFVPIISGAIKTVRATGVVVRNAIRITARGIKVGKGASFIVRSGYRVVAGTVVPKKSALQVLKSKFNKLLKRGAYELPIISEVDSAYNIGRGVYRGITRALSHVESLTDLLEPNRVDNIIAAIDNVNAVGLAKYSDENAQLVLNKMTKPPTILKGAERELSILNPLDNGLALPIPFNQRIVQNYSLNSFELHYIKNRNTRVDRRFLESNCAPCGLAVNRFLMSGDIEQVAIDAFQLRNHAEFLENGTSSIEQFRKLVPDIEEYNYTMDARLYLNPSDGDDISDILNSPYYKGIPEGSDKAAYKANIFWDEVLVPFQNKVKDGEFGILYSNLITPPAVISGHINNFIKRNGKIYIIDAAIPYNSGLSLEEYFNKYWIPYQTRSGALVYYFQPIHIFPK